MATLAQMVRFAELHLTTPDGERFSLKGRDWVVDQLWRPLGGWKLWPVDREHLCSDCAARANTIVEDHAASASTRGARHAVKNCKGLSSEPVLIVAADLKRQTGKSINSAAYCLARVFKNERENIGLLAGSEDQVRRLYDRYYRQPVAADEKLKALSRLIGTRLSVPTMQSEIEVLPTSLSSVGDTRTVIVVDECRMVPPNIAVAMVPTLFARGGRECPHHHVRTHSGVDDPEAPKTCSVCSARLQPWYGKALLLSSAGEIKDGDQDWFFEFVTHYRANPHPNVHVFVSDDSLNPKISQKVVDATGEIFGALESTRVFAGIEMGNQHLRRGQVFMSRADVKRCVDSQLKNSEDCAGPCVGFLDTSITVEKTSQVILTEDKERSTKPWEFVYQSRLDFWIPQGRAIDSDHVREVVRSTLRMFKGLRIYYVDTRGMPWAVDLVRDLAKEFPRLVRAFTKGDGDLASVGWQTLAARMLARPLPTIRLQACPEQEREFEGLVLKAGARDPVPKVTDRDRRKSHKDITEGLAMCCYLIEREKLRTTAQSFSAWQSRTTVRVPSASRESIAGALGENSW